MADEEIYELLKSSSVIDWNRWRAKSPGRSVDLTYAKLGHEDLQSHDLANVDLSHAELLKANLSGANLIRASLKDADLRGAECTGANISEADMFNVDLTNADLTSANLSGADLTNSDLTSAYLRGVNFRGANLTDVIWDGAWVTGAIVDYNTKGLDSMPEQMREKLVHEQQDPGSEKKGTPISRSAAITIADAKRIIGPASIALNELAIPNDLSEEDRDLFLKLRRQIKKLEQSLTLANEEKSELLSENQELRAKINTELPLWEQAYRTFVLKSAESAGENLFKMTGKGTSFSAGFVCGMLFRTFS